MTWIEKILSAIGENPRDVKRRLDKTIRIKRDLEQKLDKTLRIIGGDADSIKKRASSIKKRIDRAIDNNKISDESTIYTTGRIFMFVTQAKSQGEGDFINVVSRQKIQPHRIVRLDRMKHNSEALYFALSKIERELCAGDIIAIVRGGGDTTKAQFAPYKNKVACNKLKEVADRYGVITVTGIGHTGDVFPIDKVADYSQETPTDAANRVAWLISGQITL